MNSTGLSGKDVCAIIKACRQNGVAEFHFGPMEVYFSNQEPVQRISRRSAKPEPYLQVINEQELVEEDALLKEEVDDREDELQELWLTDPVKAEELALSGELEDEDAD